MSLFKSRSPRVRGTNRLDLVVLSRSNELEKQYRYTFTNSNATVPLKNADGTMKISSICCEVFSYAPRGRAWIKKPRKWAWVALTQERLSSLSPKCGDTSLRGTLRVYDELFKRIRKMRTFGNSNLWRFVPSKVSASIHALFCFGWCAT